MQHDSHKLYVRWIEELWNGNFDIADELVSPDFIWKQEGKDDVRGPVALTERIAEAREPFSDIEFSVVLGPIAEDGLVAGRWTAHGTYAGGIPGASAPAGKAITLTGSDMLAVADGRFVEYWVCSDGLGLMTQLGALG